MLDAESGKTSWIDTSSKKIRNRFSGNYKKRAEKLKQDFYEVQCQTVVIGMIYNT